MFTLAHEMKQLALSRSKIDWSPCGRVSVCVSVSHVYECVGGRTYGFACVCVCVCVCVHVCLCV